MPRLIPRHKQELEPLMVATRTVHSNGSQSLVPYICRGQVLPRSDSRVRQHPEAFEEAPVGVVRGREPKEGEAVAIAQAAFIAFDGAWVWPGRRFHLYDAIVRRHPGFFWREFPAE